MYEFCLECVEKYTQKYGVGVDYPAKNIPWHEKQQQVQKEKEMLARARAEKAHALKVKQEENTKEAERLAVVVQQAPGIPDFQWQVLDKTKWSTELSAGLGPRFYDPKLARTKIIGGQTFNVHVAVPGASKSSGYVRPNVTVAHTFLQFTNSVVFAHCQRIFT